MKRDIRVRRGGCCHQQWPRGMGRVRSHCLHGCAPSGLLALGFVQGLLDGSAVVRDLADDGVGALPL